MCIKPLSARKLENLSRKIYCKPYFNESKRIYTPGFNTRINIERYALETDPVTYIKNKTYLAKLERDELVRTKMI